VIDAIRVRPCSIVAKHVRPRRSRYNATAMSRRRDSSRDMTGLNDLMFKRLVDNWMVGLLMVDLAIRLCNHLILLVTVLCARNGW
jgi:hypothetical protein